MDALVAVEVGVVRPQAGTSSPSGADRQMEPVSAEARRMARLRSDRDLWLLSTDDQVQAEPGATIGRQPGRCGYRPIGD